MQPRRPVARTPAPCVPAPWTRWAAYGGMQASCGGQGTAWALPGRERAPGTRESPGESPRPGRRGCHCLPGLLPWGLALLARGPGSPQVNAFCGRRGQEAADSLTEVGLGHTGPMCEQLAYVAANPQTPPSRPHHCEDPPVLPSVQGSPFTDGRTGGRPPGDGFCPSRGWVVSGQEAGPRRRKQAPPQEHPSGQRAPPLRYQARSTGSLGWCQS